MPKSKVLRVGFPLFSLRQDDRVFNPENTEFSTQYYLLENLAARLVRDSSQSPSGYAPDLAQSWEQISNRWIFHLRPNLKWSDGSLITPQTIAAHIESLRDGKYRHILYLKKLLHAKAEGENLILDFQTPINDGLIHELSLADTGLLHPSNREKGWRVTSGPYYIKTYEPGKKLLLWRNPYYPTDWDYPESVELVGYTRETIVNLFDTVEIDLLKIFAPSFYEPNRKVFSKSVQNLRGYPTGIYYFCFNPKNPIWSDVENRRAFALLVEQALGDFSYRELTRERQLIPKGYSGHLENPPRPQEWPANKLSGKRLTINMFPPFAKATSIIETLKSHFQKNQVVLDFQFSWALDLNAVPNSTDILFSQFVGNQLDALGSWSFLFSPGQGTLSVYRNRVAPLFEQVITAKDKMKREEALRNIHRKVLENVYAIPVFVESPLVLASKRVDLSNINRFDMRLRFYDIQWK